MISLTSLIPRSPTHTGCVAAWVITVTTLLVGWIPGWSETFQWQRGGSLIQGLTGHLSHWSWDHLLWDLIAFAALSFAALRIIPNRYLVCLAATAIAIPLEIAFNQPQFQTYRGLSGIDSALFGLIAAGLWKYRAEKGVLPWAKFLAALAISTFLAKTLYELSTGQTVFVTNLPEAAKGSFTPAVSAHLVGATTGVLVGLLRIPNFTFCDGSCKTIAARNF